MTALEGFAGRTAVVTGAGGGMGLQIARDLSKPARWSPASTSRIGRGARGRGIRPGDVSDDGSSPARSRRVRRERPPRLPGECRGRAVVRARPLAARHRSRDLEPGDRDQPHRLHADRAPRDPADAPGRRRRWCTFRRPSACAATTGPRTPIRSRPASALSKSIAIQFAKHRSART